MGLKSIPRAYYNTLADINRKTTTPDDVGDLAQSWSLHQGGIPATIQTLTAEEIIAFQGEIYNYTHRAFIPKTYTSGTASGIVVNLREGDKLYDQETLVSYKVKLIEDLRPARKTISGSSSHHYELILEKINDTRYV